MRRAILALVSGNLAGKLIGVLRELLLAALFGTTAPVAAFRIANTGTFVPINFVASDALSAGFLPNHSRLTTATAREAAIFYRVVEQIVVGVGVIAGIVVVVFRDGWSSLIAPGSPRETLHLAAAMLAIMGVSIPFYIHTNLAAYLEMSNGGHRIIAVRPAFQSVGLIVGTVFAFVLGQALWLAGGFTAVYVLMSIWATIRVHRLGYTRVDGESVTGGEWKCHASLFVRSLLPVLGLPILMQGASVCERAFASLSDTHAVAALDYARLISDTANVLIAWPVGLVVLGSFARMVRHEMYAALEPIGNRVLFIGIVLSALCSLWARPLIVLVYQRGAFDVKSSVVTAEILVGLAVGLWAQTLAYIHVKALNAISRNGLAALVSAIGAAGWIAGQAVLTPLLGPLGLGLGASTGAIIQLITSTFILRQGVAVGSRCFEMLPVLVLAAGIPVVVWNCVLFQQVLVAGCATIFILAWLMAIPRLRRELFSLVRSS